ncbi:MAG: T9SS type A sorting domain-containing protein [Salinivirgaceae bacterium]|nr:T9SS type A sorting domain-containing protein [Salinivirgaceae bacterium]
MKKYFFIFFTIVFLALQAKAQNIELYHENSLINVDTIEVFGNVKADTLHTYIFQGDTTYYYAYEALVEIDIKNTSSSSLDVQCRKRHIQLISETQNYFCWSSCFPPYTFESIVPVNIPANGTTDIFSGHYKPNGNLGCILVAYTFFNNENPSDSAMVVVKFIMDSCNPTSIAENNMQKQFSLPYPNPATNYFTINKELNMQQSGSIELYNGVGQLITTTPFKATDSYINMNTNQLKSGTYYYRIISKNTLFKSGTVIILP